MRRPEFYYIGLGFKKHFNMLSELEVSKIRLNSDYEHCSFEGVFRGCHYQLLFTHQDKIVTANFIYTNFERPHCNFNFSYSFLFSDLLEKFVDFFDFCVTMSTMMNGFFYKKNFSSDFKIGV